MKIQIEDVEKTIKIPAERWRGKCHQIAALMLEHKLVKGKLRYGHWTGPVVNGSKFEKYPDGLVHHGWIELPNGQIVDPTRFEFEQKAPYIYVGKNDYYDAGSNKYRLDNMKPPPKYNALEKQITLEINDDDCPIVTPSYSMDAIQLIEDLLERNVKDGKVNVTVKQAFWLANLPLQILDKAAKPIYSALIRAEMSGLIPFDNRKLVFEG